MPTPQRRSNREGATHAKIDRKSTTDDVRGERTTGQVATIIVPSAVQARFEGIA
jgi:hypothetical protein